MFDMIVGLFKRMHLPWILKINRMLERMKRNIPLPDSPEKILIIDLTEDDEDEASIEDVEDIRPDWMDAPELMVNGYDATLLFDDSTSEISTLSDPETTSKRVHYAQ